MTNCHIIKLYDNEMGAHKRNKRISNLLQVIARKLEAYESEHFSLAHPTPIDVLHFLMEEHSLSQSELPEIGSQSLVSNNP